MRVRCLQAKRCKGKLRLRRLRKGRSALLLGSATATVKARARRTIVVKVRRKRLDRHRTSRVRIEFAGRDATGARRGITAERDAEAPLSPAVTGLRVIQTRAMRRTKIVATIGPASRDPSAGADGRGAAWTSRG